MSLLPEVESPHTKFLRRQQKLAAEYQAGAGSRAVTLSAPQLALLEHLLAGVEGPVADSLRLVLDFDDHVCAGQGPCEQEDVVKTCPCRR